MVEIVIEEIVDCARRPVNFPSVRRWRPALACVKVGDWMASDVLLGLGSNVGDRERQLALAVAGLARRGFAAEARSSLYLTEPVDAPPQDWFVNAAVRGRISLPPEELLSVCLDVERGLGRLRETYHGPRTVDIDVLLYDDEIRHGTELTLPHPRLHERRFVLVPAVEVAPERRHPVLGRTLTDLLHECPDASRVTWHRPPEAWS
jgi:2-amino-4-hydroxy-6-hydroxymethyldihydropteridine diphosphokinase